MSNLLTENPIALRTLMSETIFVLPSPEGGGVASPAPESRSAPVPLSGDRETEKAREAFVYQGDKSSGMLFLLRDAVHPYFSPQAEEAFAKMIGALGLTPQNVAVVNLANADNPNDFPLLMDFFQPKKIALLGVDPVSLKLPAIPQNTYRKGKKATVFHTFGFAEMLADANKKKTFWAEFKAFVAA